MQIASSLLALSAVALTVFACSGTSGEDVFVIVTPTTQQALAGTLCNKIEECTGDLFMQGAFGTAGACDTRYFAQQQLEVRSAGYGLSEQAGAVCNTALGAATCADLLSGNLPEACRVRGSLADGATCTVDAQCASASCFIDDAAACGKCGPRAALGADCTNANCEYGLKCGGSTKTCTNGQPGASCSKDDDCRFLSVCRSGKCAELLKESVTCTVGPIEREVPCNFFQGLFCLPEKLGDAAGTCKKATISHANVDEKCGLTSLSPFAVTLCTNGECKSDKCVARKADGTSCTTDENLCQQPAKCRNGICSMKDPDKCK